MINLDRIERQTLTIAEVATILGVSINAVSKAAASGELPAVRLGHRVLIVRSAFERWLAASLEQQERSSQHQRDSLASLLTVCDVADSVQDQFDDAEKATALDAALGRLDERERRIIELRYGLKDGRCRTLAEIGREFRLTRERIRQLEHRALQRLRWRFEKNSNLYRP